MAERMIIEPVKRMAENYLETRNKVIEKSVDTGRSTRVRDKKVFYQQRGIYTGRLHESGAK